MFSFFKKKKPSQTESIKIIDKRTNAQSITPAKGDIDPIHAILIGAAMQSGGAVFGNFEGNNLEISD